MRIFSKQFIYYKTIQVSLFLCPGIIKYVFWVIKRFMPVGEQKYWNQFAAQSFESGSGTPEDPILIATPEQLALLAQSLKEGKVFEGTYFKQIDDIDLKGHLWDPMGGGSMNMNIDIHPETAFAGYYDGNGMSIQNMKMFNSRYAALFTTLATGAVIENLTLEDTCEIYVLDSTLASASSFVVDNYGTIRNCCSGAAIYACGMDACVGGIAAGCRNGEIINCSNKGTLFAYGKKAAKCGGIVCINEGCIIYSLNKGFCQAKSASDVFAGGIAAKNRNYISCCGNQGAIAGSTRCDLELGGIAGLTFDVIINSYNTGAVSGTVAKAFHVGGIAGKAVNALIHSCYNTGIVMPSNTSESIAGSTLRTFDFKLLFSSTQTISVDEPISSIINCYVPGVCDGLLPDVPSDSSSVCVLTEDTMKENSTVNALNSMNDTALWLSDIRGENHGFPVLFNRMVPPISIWKGAGTRESPWLIASSFYLVALSYWVMQGNPTRMRFWSLTANIRMGSITGFVPIGGWVSRSVSNPNLSFYGVFNGNGFTINNLCIELTDVRFGCVGLFGSLGCGSVVMNTGLNAKCSIHVRQSQSCCVGSLAGIMYNFASISACYNHAAVMCENSGDITLGGLVGYNNKGHIAHCYNTSQPEQHYCTNTFSGGIAGRNLGLMKSCYYSANKNNVFFDCSKNKFSLAHNLEEGSYINCIDVNDGYFDRTCYIKTPVKGIDIINSNELRLNTTRLNLNSLCSEVYWTSDLTPPVNDGFPLLVWQKHILTFCSNGGIGKMKDQTLLKDKETKIKKCVFQRTGFIFTGWNTDKNGSGIRYTDEQAISSNYSLKLYAQWRNILKNDA